MTSFSCAEPIFRRKQAALDVQDLQGLLRIQIQVSDRPLFSRFYTRIDQVFLLWGTIVSFMFLTAQFTTLSWTIQAVIWSLLTLVGSWATIHLTWYWVTVEQLRWVVYGWIGLMGVGVALTNWGVLFGGWGLLPYLCPLWLGLNAAGYLGTAWGLRSRAFLLSALLHGLAAVAVPHMVGWQYLATGIVLASPLFVLAEAQWDMRSTSNFSNLTTEQRHFNQQQQLRRSKS
ncbi:MAG: hypothetical protein HC881_05185 [Leptolyngbyaceae cyanobacterium SL_7_1]|nr:hypothetical protein [Leptolyngbyaceae cyanobacterium SL_7_1]